MRARKKTNEHRLPETIEACTKQGIRWPFMLPTPMAFVVSRVPRTLNAHPLLIVVASFEAPFPSMPPQPLV